MGYENVAFVRTLSMGALSQVHLARAPASKATVVVKVMENTPENWILYQNEVNLLTHTQHPNIVRLLDNYVDTKFLYIVCEHLSGGDLLSTLKERGRFEEDVAIGLLRQILDAVNHLHNKGACHRDIKPENICFIDQQRCHLKLIDFGFSCDKNAQRTAIYGKGTLPYLSREQVACHGQAVNAKAADIWACGVTVYVLLTGKFPWKLADSPTDNDYQRFAKEQFEGTTWGSFGDHVRTLLKGMLHANPSRRWTAHECLKYIDKHFNIPKEQLKQGHDNYGKALRSNSSFDLDGNSVVPKAARRKSSLGSLLRRITSFDRHWPSERRSSAVSS
eukprot:Colp12_sorted_trinity150504_noHs@9275